jgi:hypothetical protein
MGWTVFVSRCVGVFHLPYFKHIGVGIHPVHPMHMAVHTDVGTQSIVCSHPQQSILSCTVGSTLCMHAWTNAVVHLIAASERAWGAEKASTSFSFYLNTVCNSHKHTTTLTHCARWVRTHIGNGPSDVVMSAHVLQVTLHLQYTWRGFSSPPCNTVRPHLSTHIRSGW